jgi:hypothetical protein
LEKNPTKIRLTQWKKMHSNKFMPGMFDVTQNMCDVLDRKSSAHQFIKTFLDQVDPGRYEVYNRLLHPCPYSVSKSILWAANFQNCVRILYARLQEKWSIQLNHSNKKATKNYFNIMSPGEYKTVTRVYDDRNLTFYQLSTFYNVL